MIRDVFNEDFGKLVVSGDEAWDVVDEYVKYVAPHLTERVTRWQGNRDAFAEYRIDEQLAKALERKVWLPSGGSLVIDKTEAMTVVDVNTGKFTGQGGNLEETVTRNNLEAAEEIVRQLRLRDVGGIVVIDFIDMVLESNRELVLRRLLECLSRDRTKHQVAEVTSLGLVQMTRKRVGAGLLEAFSTPCECCNGRGVILTFDPDSDGPAPAHHTHSRGHGNGGGFTFESNHDDGTLAYADVAGAWGDLDLEWLALLSCQVLKEEWGGQRWWQRWGPSFDGLHLLAEDGLLPVERLHVARELRLDRIARAPGLGLEIVDLDVELPHLRGEVALVLFLFLVGIVRGLAAILLHA